MSAINKRYGDLYTCKENYYGKNIPLDFVYRFLSSFDISGAIWVLYMVSRGLSLWQVGIAEGVFHVASFLFEVPSGALADLLGKKKVILAGRFCTALSSLLMLGAGNIYDFIIAFVISALGYNLNSGSEEALLFDSMMIEGREQEYQRMSGRMEVVVEISQAAAVFLGGVLSEYSFRYCYLAAIVIALCAMVPAFCFREPPVEAESRKKLTDGEMPEENRINNGDYKEKNKKGREGKRLTAKMEIRKHGAVCADILRNNREVRDILIYYPAVDAFCAVIFFYGQEYFAQLGLNRIEISLVMLVNGGMATLGALSSDFLTRRLKERTRFVISGCVALGCFLVSSGYLPLAVVGFFGMGFGAAVLDPLRSAELNGRIPSAQRATIISIDSMMFSCFMLVIFPFMGLIADIAGMVWAFMVNSFFLAIFYIFFIR